MMMIVMMMIEDEASLFHIPASTDDTVLDLASDRETAGLDGACSGEYCVVSCSAVV